MCRFLEGEYFLDCRVTESMLFAYTHIKYDAMEYEVRHNEGKHRFEASENGHMALVEYQILDRGLMNIYHTEVPDSIEGLGVGSALMREALAFARKNHYKVLPTCSFAQVYVGMHPNYQDMLV